MFSSNSCRSSSEVTLSYYYINLYINNYYCNISSIVGRADCLCGLFYILAIKLYIKAIRSSNNNNNNNNVINNNNDSNNNIKISRNIILIFSSYILAFLATLAKEIGATIFGIFITIELIEILRVQYGTSANKKNVKSIPKTVYSLLIQFIRSYHIILR